MAVQTGDMFGLDDRQSSSLGVVGSDPGRKLSLFSEWLYRTAYAVLIGDAEWARKHIELAYESGVMDGAKITGARRVGGEMALLHMELAHRELEGIADAAVQVGTRMFSRALSRHLRPALAVRLLRAAMTKVAVRRLNAMCNTLTVAAHNEGRLDQFELAGIKSIGVLPEHFPTFRTFDAKREPALPRSEENRLAKLRGISQEASQQVNVETAGDDRVCDECEDIAAGGPYDLDEARDLLPAHVDCRCALVPADDARFKANTEEDDEDF